MLDDKVFHICTPENLPNGTSWVFDYAAFFLILNGDGRTLARRFGRDHSLPAGAAHQLRAGACFAARKFLRDVLRWAPDCGGWIVL
jgi:hypothetical protein